MSQLADVLAAHTKEGELWEPIDRDRIRCYACGHECALPDGALGVCKVRFNRGGRLRVPWGYVGGVQCDPIEKKPFFHVLPGSLAYSFGMLGCDIERLGYEIRSYRLTPDAHCPSCGTPVPGCWSAAFSGQLSPAPFVPVRTPLHDV